MASQLQGEIKGQISVETVPCMEIEWKVPEDILLLPRDTEHRIHSPTFDFKDAAWYLRLTFSAPVNASLDFIDLYIVKKYPVSSRLRLMYRIGIKRTNGNRYRSFQGDCQNNMYETDLDCWGQIGILSRSDLVKNKTDLVHNGVVRFFCYFWVETAVSFPSVPTTSFLNFLTTAIVSQISENIGEISSEKAGAMYVEWKVWDIHLLSPNTKYRIRSSSFQFKGEIWFLQATIDDRNFSGTCATIAINPVREECASPTLYVDYKIGLKLFNGKASQVLTNQVISLEIWTMQAPNGEVTFFCYFRSERSRDSSEASSKKTSEGSLGEKNAVPTVSSSSTLNSTPEKRKFSAGASKLFEDFKNLFFSGEDSDLSIKVKDTEFRVHKSILRARSSVFHSMLSHDMKEKNSGIVDITDCEPEAFKIFLLYLYNGCVENLSTDTVFDLCKAADKYDAEELKLKCKDFMLTNLSVDTVCYVIDHALQYDEEELLKTATDFFAKNFKDIILTVNWQIFMKKNTAAANELLIKASNYYVLKDE